MNRLLTQMFTWKTKNSQVLFQPLLLSLDRKRLNSWSVLLSSSSGEAEWSVDAIVCSEIEETSVPSDVLLAHGFVLYSSSRSGSLASGAICLSSTLRRYWCLAMKYCMCWDVARRRWETVIIVGHAHTHARLLFPCAMVCVWCLCMCQLFECGSVFDFGIFQLVGWQFKTSEWNISKPSSKLQWYTHEVIVIL